MKVPRPEIVPFFSSPWDKSWGMPGGEVTGGSEPRILVEPTITTQSSLNLSTESDRSVKQTEP